MADKIDEKQILENIKESIRRDKLKKETKAKRPIRWQEPKLEAGVDYEDPDWKSPSEETIIERKMKPKKRASNISEEELDKLVERAKQSIAPKLPTEPSVVEKAIAATNRPRGQYDLPSSETRVNSTPPENPKPLDHNIPPASKPRGRGQYDLPSSSSAPKTGAKPVEQEKVIKSKAGGSVPKAGSLNGPFIPPPKPTVRQGSVPKSDSTGSIPNQQQSNNREARPERASHHTPVHVPNTYRNPGVDGVRNWRNILKEEIGVHGFGQLGAKFAGVNYNSYYGNYNHHRPGYGHRPDYVRQQRRIQRHARREGELLDYRQQRRFTENAQSTSLNKIEDKIDNIQQTTSYIRQDINRILYMLNELKANQDAARLANKAPLTGNTTPYSAASQDNKGGMSLTDILASAVGGAGVGKWLKNKFSKTPPVPEIGNKPPVSPAQGKATSTISEKISNFKQAVGDGVEAVKKSPITSKVGEVVKKVGAKFGTVLYKALGPLALAGTLYDIRETKAEQADTIKKIAENPSKAVNELPQGSIAQKIAERVRDTGKKLSEKEVEKIYLHETSKIQQAGVRGRIDKVTIKELEQAAQAGKTPEDADENIKYLSGNTFQTYNDFKTYVSQNPEVKEITKGQYVSLVPVPKEPINPVIPAIVPPPTPDQQQTKPVVETPSTKTDVPTSHSIITKKEEETNFSTIPPVVSSAAPVIPSTKVEPRRAPVPIVKAPQVNNNAPQEITVVPTPIEKPPVAPTNLVPPSQVNTPVEIKRDKAKETQATLETKEKSNLSDHTIYANVYKVIGKDSIIFQSPKIIFKGDIETEGNNRAASKNFITNENNTNFANHGTTQHNHGGKVTNNRTYTPPRTSNSTSSGRNAVTNNYVTRNSVTSNNTTPVYNSINTIPANPGSYNPPAIAPNLNNRYGSTATVRNAPTNNIPSANLSKGVKGNAKEAIAFFISKGWTPEQAAGIVGNLIQESELFTGAHNKREDAQGVAQWRADRVQRFEQLYKKRILEASFKEQLEYVHWELNNSEKSAGDRLRQARSAEEAAHIIDALYERSAGTERNVRIANAKAVLEQYKPGETNTETSSNNTQEAITKNKEQIAPIEQGSIESQGGPTMTTAEVSTANITPPPAAKTPTPIQKPTVGQKLLETGSGQAGTENIPVNNNSTTTNNNNSTTINNSTTNNKPGPNVQIAGTADISKVSPKLMEGLNKTAEEFGQPVTVTSAYRDDQKQAELWVRANILKEPGIFMPARPATAQTVTVNGQSYQVAGGGRPSSHGKGEAVDVPQAPQLAAKGLLQKHGLSLPFGSSDPVHIQLAGSVGGDSTVPTGGAAQPSSPGVYNNSTMNTNKYNTVMHTNNNSVNNRFSGGSGGIPTALPGLPSPTGPMHSKMNIPLPGIKTGSPVLNAGINFALPQVINSITGAITGGRNQTINNPVYNRGNSISINPLSAITSIFQSIMSPSQKPTRGERFEQSSREAMYNDPKNKKVISDAFNAPTGQTVKPTAHVSPPNQYRNDNLNVHPSPTLMREITSVNGQPSIVKGPDEMGIGQNNWGNQPSIA